MSVPICSPMLPTFERLDSPLPPVLFKDDWTKEGLKLAVPPLLKYELLFRGATNVYYAELKLE
jgi:hypothetical protein